MQLGLPKRGAALSLFAKEQSGTVPIRLESGVPSPAMSALETPMTRRLWDEIGGTLFEEYAAVRPSCATGAGRLDGLVLVDGPFRLARRGEAPDLSGQRLIVIQTKATRLGMNMLGQALFSAEIVRDRDPAEVRTIALCTADDDVLRPLAERYGIEVVVDDGAGPRWMTDRRRDRR
jgi:hypothetical protein